MQVFVYIGAALLAVVIVMSILLICGLPLGEFSMGGRFGKVWPPKIRIIGNKCDILKITITSYSI